MNQLLPYTSLNAVISHSKKMKWEETCKRFSKIWKLFSNLKFVLDGRDDFEEFLGAQRWPPVGYDVKKFQFYSKYDENILEE